MRAKWKHRGGNGSWSQSTLLRNSLILGYMRTQELEIYTVTPTHHILFDHTHTCTHTERVTDMSQTPRQKATHETHFLSQTLHQVTLPQCFHVLSVCLTAPQAPTCQDAHSGSSQLPTVGGLLDGSQKCSLSFSSSAPILQDTCRCLIPFPQVTRHWKVEGSRMMIEKVKKRAQHGKSVWMCAWGRSTCLHVRNSLISVCS